VSLKRLYACTSVLTVGPRGVVLPSLSARAPQAYSRREER
jgi:hypothetical protein